MNIIEIQISIILLKENECGNIVYKRAAILSRDECVNILYTYIDVKTLVTEYLMVKKGNSPRKLRVSNTIHG